MDAKKTAVKQYLDLMFRTLAERVIPKASIIFDGNTRNIPINSRTRPECP